MRESARARVGERQREREHEERERESARERAKTGSERAIRPVRFQAATDRVSAAAAAPRRPHLPAQALQPHTESPGRPPRRALPGQFESPASCACTRPSSLGCRLGDWTLGNARDEYDRWGTALCATGGRQLAGDRRDRARVADRGRPPAPRRGAHARGLHTCSPRCRLGGLTDCRPPSAGAHRLRAGTDGRLGAQSAPGVCGLPAGARAQLRPL